MEIWMTKSLELSEKRSQRTQVKLISQAKLTQNFLVKAREARTDARECIKTYMTERMEEAPAELARKDKSELPGTSPDKAERDRRRESVNDEPKSS
jgi:hypothetical protein